MLKIIFTGVLLLFTEELFCQSSKITVLQNERSAGKNNINQEIINAKEYVFPERIFEYYIDPSSGLLTVLLRGLSMNGKWLNNRGNIVMYDLINKNVKWSKPIFFQTSSIQQLNNTIIQSSGNKSYCLDINSGENLWQVRNDIYFADPVCNIGLGYEYKTARGYTNILQGINLKTGQFLWQKELNRDYGWNDVFYLNDSTVIVVAGGLHSINLKNGIGWDYNTITGVEDYRAAMAANAAGVALGVLTGTFFISTGYNLVRDVVSNVIVDSADLYFASREKISRINKSDGKVLWSCPIFNSMASKSKIFATDSLIYMINYGFAYMGFMQVNLGTPFFAAYNKEDGAQRFFSAIITDKKPIMDFLIKDDSLVLIFKDQISVYALEDGAMLQTATFDEKKHGDLNSLIGNKAYYQAKDSSFTSLPIYFDNEINVLTSTGNVLAIDKELNIKEQLNFDDLFISYLELKNLMFLARAKKTVVIKNNDVIAEFEASANSFLLGEKLFDIEKNTLLEIDISGIIGDGVLRTDLD
jgi:outer membrane protein assembly factor BamB